MGNDFGGNLKNVASKETGVEVRGSGFRRVFCLAARKSISRRGYVAIG